MDSPRKAAAAHTAAPAAPQQQHDAGPSTPEVLHPTQARISAAARAAADAAASGFAAAVDGVRHVAAAAPTGPQEIASVPDNPISAARLGSDIGLAGLAEAAGHAWHDLHVPHFGTWQQRVQLVQWSAGLVLAATLVYSFLFAPNDLGMRHDLSLLSRAFSDDALAFVLFNLLGLFPFINNCLMWPALRSQGLQPAMWPHLVASYFAGAFALLSYLVRWRPHPQGMPRLALKAARLTGNTVWLQRQHESRLMPAIITASIAALLALCPAATPATWAHFGFLFTHSKAVHVMCFDLSLLTLMSPFLVVADARARGVRLAQSPAGAVFLGFAMLAVPLVAPGVYLLVRPVTPAPKKRSTGRGRIGFGQAVGGLLHSWLSHVWPSSGSVTGRVGAGGQPLRAARGRVARGGRQLRHSAAAAAAAGSNAAAAGSSLAANVVSAAQVPLPSGQQAHAAADAAAHAAGAAAGTAMHAAGFAAGRVSRGWQRVKQGAVRFFSGGYPHLATAARSGSADEGFVAYQGDAAAAAAATDSSDSTDHQHHTGHGGHHTAAGTNTHAAAAAAAAAGGPVTLDFPRHSALGDAAYLMTAVSPGGGRELLFADDYNEAEAESEGLGEEEEEEDRELTQGEDDGPATGGYFDGADEDAENDVTFDAGEDDDEDLLGGAEQGGVPQEGQHQQHQHQHQQEEEGVVQGGGGVRGGYRRAKAVALQRLAEIAQLEHQRGYPHGR